jgi:acyl-CoA thioesterase II
VPASGDKVYAQSILASLDSLLAALRLEQVDDGRFRAAPSSAMFADRIFGGELLAQALTAASVTVAGKEPHSLHVAFVRAGVPGDPVELLVDRVRDGRSMSTRRVTIVQGSRTLLVAIVSFHANAVGVDVTGDPVDHPSPERLPLLQDWADSLPAELRGAGRGWIEQPMPLEVRMAEAPTFLGGSSATGSRSHWMRLPRDVGADPVLHAALLAFASDFLLLDVIFRTHPDGAGVGAFSGFSIDHALWLHRPVRFDNWHLYTQETVAIVGGRALARGSIHDAAGSLVASVTQEVLVQPMAAT